jgi:hypothetical protein
MGNTNVNARVYPESYSNLLIITEQETEILDDTNVLTPVTLQCIKTNIIDKLPEDLVIKIYKEHFEPDILFIMYKNIIESPESVRLNDAKLSKFLPIIFAKPIACKYIGERCYAFNNSFHDHKIKNTKNFVNMKKGQSFALTILFYLYH